MVGWIIVGIVIAGAVFLVVYLVRQNRKDQREYTQFLNKQEALKEEEEELNEN